MRKRKNIVMESDFELERPLQDEEDSKKGLSIAEFIRVYNEFVTVKKLEGLGERTIKDYLLHIKYLTSWLEETETDKLNRYVEKGLFLQYIGYMLEKEYKPCTINIRLRTLKCYLRCASKLKLVKVPKDSIEPLNPQEIKKMIRTLNLQEYSQLRDFCLMVLIIDTGVRINEACNLLIDDLDVKNKTIKIRSEIAKNREARILPVSSKTTKYLQRLVKIAQHNEEDYIFISLYGGKLESLTAIKNFEKYGKRAGITKKKTTPHQFRRAFAIESVKAGMGVFTLQKMLGHADISTTRIYVNLDNTHLINSHRKINVINRFI